MENTGILDPITIPLKEYQELLITKGKYEELKDIYNNKLNSSLVNRTPILYKDKNIENTNSKTIGGVYNGEHD